MAWCWEAGKMLELPQGCHDGIDRRFCSALLPQISDDQGLKAFAQNGAYQKSLPLES
jgi:hypothetical protein